MKICILETQLPPESCQHLCPNYSILFQRMLNLSNSKIELSSYRVMDGIYPKEDEKFDCFLITGSREDSFSNIKWVQDLRCFICKEIKKGSKFIGVCFGHQILALCIGGKVNRSKKGFGLGVQTYKIEKTFFMDDDLKELNILVYHQDQVESLPDQAQIFAYNDFCPIAGFVYENQILGMQGHSEYSKEYILKLMEIYNSDLMEEQLNQIEISMQKSITDQKVIVQWMINFIKS